MSYFFRVVSLGFPACRYTLCYAFRALEGRRFLVFRNTPYIALFLPPDGRGGKVKRNRPRERCVTATTVWRCVCVCTRRAESILLINKARGRPAWKWWSAGADRRYRGVDEGVWACDSCISVYARPTLPVRHRLVPTYLERRCNKCCTREEFF